jgi:serine/threonine-protein kinase
LTESDPELDVPPAIEKLVLDCLAKDPNQRPASARDLSERFETALAHEEVLHELEAPHAYPVSDERPSSNHDLHVADPDALVYHLEAWMPEAIAVHKLRGFMIDVGGNVLQTAPGRVRVSLGGPGSAYQYHASGLTWLGIGRKSSEIEMDLRMQQLDAERNSRLLITVIMRSLNGSSAFDPLWRALAAQVFCDLRGYLMGQSGEVVASP